MLQKLKRNFSMLCMKILKYNTKNRVNVVIFVPKDIIFRGE